MSHSTISLPPDACPASAVIMAARLAQTPLAIAEAGGARPSILFANDAFAALMAVDAAALVGRALDSLAASETEPLQPGRTARFELGTKNGSSFPVALSTAVVAGPDGAPMCLLCSLVDARGDGADDAIARDAELLVQVARAAGDLMRESAVAAQAGASPERGGTASGIALDAFDRAANAVEGERA